MIPQPLKRARRFLKRLLANAAGMAMTEFALMSPILIVGGVTGLEYINFVLSRQKVERLAATTADLFARNQIPPTESQVLDIFKAVNLVGSPFDLKQHGRVIVTGVIGTKDFSENPPVVENRVVWQRCSGELDGRSSAHGSEWTTTSNYADGPAVDLPNNIVLAQTDMAIVAEVFYEYKPLINASLVSGLGSNPVFKETSVYRTRGKAFTNITPLPNVVATPCA